MEPSREGLEMLANLRKRMRPIKAGELCLITCGAYSDYGTVMLDKAKRDVDVEALLWAYLEAHPEQKKEHQFNDGQFLGFLSAKDLFEELPFTEFHLSDYRRAEEITVTDPYLHTL